MSRYMGSLYVCFLLRNLAYSFSPYFSLCSTRVSNELGAGQPQAAKLATRVVMCIAFSAGLLLGSTMILLRNLWGHMYSNEPEVITYIARMIPVLAISFFTDGLHSSLSGYFSLILQLDTSLSPIHKHSRNRIEVELTVLPD